MCFLWEKGPVQQAAPAGGFAGSSGATKLPTQACRSKHSSQRIPAHGTITAVP